MSYGGILKVYDVYGKKIASFEPPTANSNDRITCLYAPNQTMSMLPDTIIESKSNSGGSHSNEMITKPSYYTCCHVFTGHEDGVIRLWSLIHNGNEFDLARLIKLRGHTFRVTAINVTGNGNIVISGIFLGFFVFFCFSNTKPIFLRSLLQHLK